MSMRGQRMPSGLDQRTGAQPSDLASADRVLTLVSLYMCGILAHAPSAVGAHRLALRRYPTRARTSPGAG